MNRRSFLQALSGGLVAGAAVPFLPVSAPPLGMDWAVGESFTVATRYIVNPPGRQDILYGIGIIAPGTMVRIDR